MSHELHLVDAFTDVPFAGNPAAVCLLQEPAADAWLQNVAREMNQAETAFVRPLEGEYELRWFTPVYEVDLCGHATLASAHLLWQKRQLEPSAIVRFRTRSGVLTARRDGEWITLDFPATRPEPCTPPPDLLESLGTGPAEVQRSKFDYFVVLEDPQKLRRLAPDMGRLATIDTRGAIVTAPSDEPGIDFFSRFFAPRAGVPEDPVTGSAHCALTPYWSARLGRTRMVGRQLSPRGGSVRVEDLGERVLLSGKAVTVASGELL